MLRRRPRDSSAATVLVELCFCLGVSVVSTNRFIVGPRSLEGLGGVREVTAAGAASEARVQSTVPIIYPKNIYTD